MKTTTQEPACANCGNHPSSPPCVCYCPTGCAYTVLLLYPDYLNDTGSQTYLAHERGRNAAEAGARARARAARGASENMGKEGAIDPADFVVLATFEGHLDDVWDPSKDEYVVEDK